MKPATAFDLGDFVRVFVEVSLLPRWPTVLRCPAPPALDRLAFEWFRLRWPCPWVVCVFGPGAEGAS